MGGRDIVLYAGWPWGVAAAIGGIAVAAAGMWWANTWLMRLISQKRRRRVLWALRAPAMLLLAAYVVQPFARVYTSVEDAAPVTILVDRTDSMELLGTASGASRREIADKAVKRLTGTFRQNNIEVRVADFGDKTGGTDLAAAAEAAAGDGAATIIVTDGGHNSASDTVAAAISARGRGAVLYGVLAGDEKLFDVAIRNVRVDRRIGIRTEVEVRATVNIQGGGDRTFRLMLKDADSRIAAEKVFRTAGAETEVSLRFTPAGKGLMLYRLDVPAEEGELVKENNSIPLAFEITNRKLKVLYMEGTQYRRAGRTLWEHQFLEQALGEDADIEVTTLLRDENTQAHAAGVPWVKHPEKGYPRSRKKLFEYDIIISSDIDIEYFSEEQLKWTVEFVERHGGGFAMVGGWTAFGPGGYDNSLIDRMLPVDMLGRYEHYVENEEYRWLLAPEALRHPIMIIDTDRAKNRAIWDMMPPFFGHNRVERAKPGASVLAVHPTDRNIYGPAVLLAVQDFGNGRSLALTTDTTAGWGELFEEEWGEGGDNRYFRAFWKNAVRWLAAYRMNAPAKHLVMETPRVTAHPGERLPVTLLARNEDYEATDKVGKATLTFRPLSGGTTITIENPGWRRMEGGLLTDVETPPPGNYIMTAKADIAGVGETSDSMGLAVSAVNVEKANPTVRPEPLGKMTEITGGRLARDMEADELARGIIRQPMYKRHYGHVEILYKWPVLAIIMILLCSEWWLRKRWGAS
ncbi:MAG TPA: hypothetical protein ENN09_07410 [Planctomycetes bacterium]|nr:hypothetical protein [Planctomycetota bacterium]